MRSRGFKHSLADSWGQQDVSLWLLHITLQRGLVGLKSSPGLLGKIWAFQLTPAGLCLPRGWHLFLICPEANLDLPLRPTSCVSLSHPALCLWPASLPRLLAPLVVSFRLTPSTCADTLTFICWSQISLPSFDQFPTWHLLGCLTCISNLSHPKPDSSSSCVSCSSRPYHSSSSILPGDSDQKHWKLSWNFFILCSVCQKFLFAQLLEYIYSLTTSVHLCCHHPKLSHFSSSCLHYCRSLPVVSLLLPFSPKIILFTSVILPKM